MRRSSSSSSSSSCFKIITCANGHSDDQDELHPTESKRSNDKRGWSFRKRSSSHRALSNNVISEKHSSGDKHGSESAVIDFQATTISSVPEKIPAEKIPVEKIPVNKIPDEKIPAEKIPVEKIPVNKIPDEKIPAEKIPLDKIPAEKIPLDKIPDEKVPVEKISVLPWLDEKPELPSSVDVIDTVVTSEIESKNDLDVEETVVIAIQSGIRGFLAKKEFVKLKTVVKLQAAIRGHLVRRHAVGTLRCVQAIVKMQSLVRARSLLGRSSVKGKTREKESNVSRMKPEVSYISIEKLLSNRFARQLLDSSPNSSINIKCDPSKPNSAWNWLERWMSASSPAASESQKPTISMELKEQEKVDHTSVRDVDEDPNGVCEPADSNPNGQLTMASENEENFIPCGDKNLTECRIHPSSTGDEVEHPLIQKKGISDAGDKAFEIQPYSGQMSLPDASLRTEFEIEEELPTNLTESISSEPLEIEEKDYVAESRKESNPAFTAAQSKHTELTEPANLARSESSSHQDDAFNTSKDTATSGVDVITGREEIREEDNVIRQNSTFQIGSECGTELSISSTLDTLDRSDVGDIEIQPEGKVLGEAPHNPDDTAIPEKESASVFDTPVQQREAENIGEESVNSSVYGEPAKIVLNPERVPTNLPVDVNSERVNQTYRSSPEASPRSHVTFPESQGTPSSQLSTQAKSEKTSKRVLSKKRASLAAAGKRTPLNSTPDSGSRNSVEQLPKDQKAAKRENSFGSAKTDNVDQERRDSGGSNSLPSYMQATESARAKLHANNSPRSSPDVLERDIYLKKRHSLPGANGRHGSPRIQQSPPQVQQGSKGNGSQFQERKWQR